MSSCATCGRRLGVGRFCANCGAPSDPGPAARPSDESDWRTDTAERKLPRTVVAPDPRTPRSAAPPAPPRYPLYADEVEDWSPEGTLVTEDSVPAPEPAPEPAPAPVTWFAEAAAGQHDDDYDDELLDEDDGRRSPWLWILAALLFLGLVAAAWWFLVRGPGSEGATGRDRGDRSAVADPVVGVDVAGRATAQTPRSAPPNQDVNGAQVAYDASNMLDGVPETAWRVAGDATGTAIRLTLPEPTELTRVGLVNGYAKTATDAQGRTFDWYAGHRRITEVVWIFPGGVQVRQSLTDQREPQLVDIDPITTAKVVLRIAGVSPPGTGTASRDFTAISEVSLIAAPD